MREQGRVGMQIDSWSATPDLNDIYRSIRELGLETHLAELGAYGFTVIEDAMSPSTVARVTEAIFDAIEDRTGRRPDPDESDAHPEMTLAHYLLFRDPVFEAVLLAE